MHFVKVVTPYYFKATIAMSGVNSSPSKKKRFSGISEFKKNAKGGILIEKKDIKKLFQFLDVNNSKYLTESDLRVRLPVFYKSLAPREYKFLMNNRSQITLDDLYDMLQQNELSISSQTSNTNANGDPNSTANQPQQQPHVFDPVYESFRIFDPSNTGFVDPLVLKNIFGNLGYKNITDNDITVLIEAFDTDNDGKINFDDFKRMSKTASEIHVQLDNTHFHDDNQGNKN